jgi:hypothetical protein
MDLLSPRTLHIYVAKVLDVAIRIINSDEKTYESNLDYVIDINDDTVIDIRYPNNARGLTPCNSLFTN